MYNVQEVENKTNDNSILRINQIILTLVRKMKTARPYQKEIIKKAVAELSRKNRTTVVMPCASGKTLVALWVIERMKARNIVVFAPTLGLLAQVAREFLSTLNKKVKLRKNSQRSF
jgi:superfamily II DNA or RNA helicase